MIEFDPPRQFGQSKKRGAKGREQASLSEPAPLNLTTYFLTAISFPAIESPPSPHHGGRDSEKRHRFNDAGD
jgi:hypothetical protein